MERSLGLTSQARKCAVYTPRRVASPRASSRRACRGRTVARPWESRSSGSVWAADAYVCDFAERRVRQLDQ
eukprot:9359449-Pyramimonas_sp.AAC.1